MRAPLVLVVLAACGEVQPKPLVDASMIADDGMPADASPADVAPPVDASACMDQLIPVIPNVTSSTTMGECCGGTLRAMTDGSGLLNDTHDCGDPTGWKSANTTSGVVTFDLGAEHVVTQLSVWNHGQLDGARGVNGVSILTSLNNADFAALAGAVDTLARAQTCPVSAQKIAVTPTRARYVRFQIASGHGAINTGLGEVQFTACDSL